MPGAISAARGLNRRCDGYCSGDRSRSSPRRGRRRPLWPWVRVQRTARQARAAVDGPRGAPDNAVRRVWGRAVLARRAAGVAAMGRAWRHDFENKGRCAPGIPRPPIPRGPRPARHTRARPPPRRGSALRRRGRGGGRGGVRGRNPRPGGWSAEGAAHCGCTRPWPPSLPAHPPSLALWARLVGGGVGKRPAQAVHLQLGAWQALMPGPWSGPRASASGPGQGPSSGARLRPSP
jgi:hypothetical protein